MSTDRDTTRVVRSWLRTDEHESADRVLGSVLDQLDTTPQRRVTWWPARRLQSMNTMLKFGLAAAVVVAVAVFIGVNTLGTSGTNVGGPGVEPTPTPQASVAGPTVEPSPSPTSTPESGLPEGPFEIAWDEMSERAPRITVTIPAPAWAGDDGILMKGNEVDNLPEAAIIAFSEPIGAGFYVYGDPCRWQSTTPETPATTVDEIAAALAAQASRDASEPVDVTVGGYAGKAITLSVPVDANFDECEGLEFASFGTDHDDLARYHQGPGQVDELWILDVDGAIVIIDTMYRQDTPAEVIDELRSIAESATFELP